jgi:transposase
MERIGMSQEERDRLDWLKRAGDGSITQRKAAEKMGVSDRWVRTLLKRMKKRGDAVVVHALRGCASNRKIPVTTQQQALTILQEPDWHDFGPTLAAEQLAKLHKIDVSKETVRVWMTQAGNFRRFTVGVPGAARSGNWCSGTPPSTTGWRGEDRFAIWCG